MRYKCRTILSKLIKIQRFRFSEKLVEKLDMLKLYGKSKSNFVRDAVEEKLSKEFPFLSKQKSKIRMPF